MADVDSNPRAVIGGNQSAFDDAIATFDFVGFLLARHETLIRAGLDDALDRPCVKVLCVLIATMNRETRTSWAGREYIAEQLGMSVKTISNYIYQLKQLGYLVSERRPTPQANNRVLMHYTLSKLNPNELEEAIERAISSIRGDRNSVVKFPSPREIKPESSCQDGNSQPTVPVRTGTVEQRVPARAGTKTASVPAPTGTQAESSRQDGHSNNNSSFLPTSNTESLSEITSRKAKPSAKGTRFDPKWKVRDTPDWGRWTTDNFDVRPSQVDREGDRFRDYWIAQPGAKGVKLDWFATWRNWVRRAFAGKERASAADATLFEIEPEQSEHERQIALVQEQRRKARLEDGLD